MTNQQKQIDRLVVALGLALEEIHHPGAARNAGLDIASICRTLIEEATRSNGVPEMIREEMVRRTTSSQL